MKNVLLFLLLMVVVAAAGVAAVDALYFRAPAFEGERRVIIPKNTRSLDTARKLAEAGIISQPELFWAIAQATGQAKQFKAGEYQFETYATPKDVMQKLASGEVVIHKITIPEGWNVRQIRAALMKEIILEGEITREVKEGSVLPETYHFMYGDSRDSVMAQMQKAMDEVLADAWRNRAQGLPLASKEEALILASIVEKETGLASEYPRVAAVYINRLRIGMRLQADPTVAYGIELATGASMERPLTYADLETPTPHNTYTNAGLPPTPIANPGKSAIMATLNPLQSDELYFVATGNGGHNFARTLEEHNRNVAAYRAALARHY